MFWFNNALLLLITFESAVRFFSVFVQKQDCARSTQRNAATEYRARMKEYCTAAAVALCKQEYDKAQKLHDEADSYLKKSKEVDDKSARKLVQKLVWRKYGRSSHIYNCDTFDENTPPVDDPEYISSLGGAIYRGMQSGDENAVWLMQGWLFSYDPFWQPPLMKVLFQKWHFRMIMLMSRTWIGIKVKRNRRNKRKRGAYDCMDSNQKAALLEQRKE